MNVVEALYLIKHNFRLLGMYSYGSVERCHEELRS